MKNDRFVITAYSRLSGMREVLTPELAKETAEELLEKEKSWKRRRGFRPYILHRIEKLKPIQLRLIFND